MIIINSSFSKEYSQLIKEYTSNINIAYNLSKKYYKDIYVFDNIPLVEYSLKIATKLVNYDEHIIVSAILYNPYKYGLDLKLNGFLKNVRKITKDYYFLNFYEISHNKNIDSKTIKNMVVQSFFKIESVILLFGEALVIYDYFPKIKNDAYKKRFLDILEFTILPLTYQLGMTNFKEEILEKLTYLKYKKKYKYICDYFKKNYPSKNLKIIKDIIIDYLKSNNQKPNNYYYRYKSLGSFYQKIYVKQEKQNFEDVLDIYALRLIYVTKKECYEVLNLIKDNFDVIENSSTKIRDFIKHPKENGYSSIHLNIILNDFPVEIQIRTIDMHNNAEFGVSAHFHYKNIEFSEKDKRLVTFLKKKTLLEKPKDKTYKDHVMVYTQTGESILVPKKSTIFDFAFYLHSDFAKFYDYAIINREIVVDKNYLLKNGDKIKIIRSKEITLKKEFLNFIFVKKNKKKFALLLKNI